MKKIFVYSLAVLLIMGMARASFAVPSSVTLDSLVESGGNYTDGISLFFEAGTYELLVAGGAWNPWHNSTGITGCNSAGADCTTGWIWSMDIFQPSTSTYYRLGDKSDRYNDSSLALSAHLGESIIINQPTDGNLFFHIKDGNPSDGTSYVWDNNGSVTADISSSTINSGPPVAPEPISSILFVFGGVTLGYNYFRKKRTVS